MEKDKSNNRDEDKNGKESSPVSMDVTEKSKESQENGTNGNESPPRSTTTVAGNSNESENEDIRMTTDSNTEMSSERLSRLRSFVEAECQEQASMVTQAKRTKTEYQLSAASPFVVYDRSGSSAMLSASPPAQLITYSPNPDQSSPRGDSPSPPRSPPVSFGSFPTRFHDAESQKIVKPIARVGAPALPSGEIVQPVRGEPTPGSRIIPLTMPNNGAILKPVVFAPWHSRPGNSSSLMPPICRPVMLGMNGPQQAGPSGILNGPQGVPLVPVNGFYSEQGFQQPEDNDDLDLDAELQAITGSIRSRLRLEEIQNYAPSGRSSLPRNRYKPPPRIVELENGEKIVIQEELEKGCITSEEEEESDDEPEPKPKPN